jgi:hypothetical protein
MIPGDIQPEWRFFMISFSQNLIPGEIAEAVAQAALLSSSLPKLLPFVKKIPWDMIRKNLIEVLNIGKMSLAFVEFLFNDEKPGELVLSVTAKKILSHDGTVKGFSCEDKIYSIYKNLFIK